MLFIYLLFLILLLLTILLLLWWILILLILGWYLVLFWFLAFWIISLSVCLLIFIIPFLIMIDFRLIIFIILDLRLISRITRWTGCIIVFSSLLLSKRKRCRCNCRIIYYIIWLIRSCTVLSLEIYFLFNRNFRLILVRNLYIRYYLLFIFITRHLLTIWMLLLYCLIIIF